jgi:hypothetical protein
MAESEDTSTQEPSTASLIATLPANIQRRIKAMQAEVDATIGKATAVLETDPWPLSFSIKSSPTADFFSHEERAQCVSFITRYQHLPQECIANIVAIKGQYYINNFDFLRHTLNDYRPIIQNQDDAVYYKRIHSAWWAMLARDDNANGTIVRAVTTDKTARCKRVERPDAAIDSTSQRSQEDSGLARAVRYVKRSARVRIPAKS